MGKAQPAGRGLANDKTTIHREDPEMSITLSRRQALGAMAAVAAVGTLGGAGVCTREGQGRCTAIYQPRAQLRCL